MVRISDPQIQSYEVEHVDTVRQMAAECVVLLKSDGSLPLVSPCRIAAYGSGVRKTVKGGTGSGDVNVRHFVTIEEGLENAGFQITTKDWLDGYDSIMSKAREDFIQEVRELAHEIGMNPVLLGMGRTMAEPEYDLPLEGEGDTAIYVLARISGEGSDRRAEAGDIELTPTEIRDILALNKKYPHFILALNVGGFVDLEPVKEVKNIILLGQLGTPTGDVLADLLLGKSVPSGKLAMTWAPINTYPSTMGFGDPDDTMYREGIFVGYRYFDTVGQPVQYPFGFGLSYTDFCYTVAGIQANEREVIVSAEVKNRGKHRGKEILQLYVSGSGGSLNKPYQELKAFAKTSELQPGEKQSISLSFPIESLASYDEKNASWIIERGDYILRLGTSSADTSIVAVLSLNENVVTQQLKNVCSCQESVEVCIERQNRPDSERTDAVPHFFPQPQKMVTRQVHYQDEAHISSIGEMLSSKNAGNGEEGLDELIGSLSREQLIRMCLGRYDPNAPQSIVGAACVSIAGGAGETSNILETMGIPALTMVDGPAGIRVSEQYKLIAGKPKGITSSISGLDEFMDSETAAQMKAMMPQPTREELEAPVYYSYCTAIPIGTDLAQSWNPEVLQKCGDIIGKEMELVGANYWLAPAMNIQRNPLCGRNFEYYSEDPLLSGLIGAAMIKGVQQHFGCAAVIKHFACNNQETNRCASNSILSERALREIYLKTFEICIRACSPHAIMTSYNLINGIHSCNRKDLLTDVLRCEWGFEGILMTDWYATQDVMSSQTGRKNKHPDASAPACLMAGNDLIMPGGSVDYDSIERALDSATNSNHLELSDLRICVKRILRQILLLTETKKMNS